MKKYIVIHRMAYATSFVILFSLLFGLSIAAQTKSVVAESVEIARAGQEFSTAHLEPAQMNSKSGIAVIFEGTEDLHYYAKPETAPAAGFELKVEANSDDFEFGETVFPRWSIFEDLTGSKVEVYSGRFIAFIPIITVRAPTKTSDIDKGDIVVKISGIACTSQICLPPFEKTLRITVDWNKRDSTTWKQISVDKDAGAISKTTQGPTYTIPFALILAFLAGLSLNIMPCVWPVLPLIVMRIVKQAQQSLGKSTAMGLAFCLGILLFFACLAGANIILQSFYNTALSWGDHLRNPAIVTALSLLMVVMALFMFGVFTITLPSSISSKSGSGQGYIGSVGIGFLAAILSTPCSFGILTLAFIWIQGQTLALGTLAIMLMGVGMAVPYAILTSMPGLLNRLPKAGRWMELFKQALGFVLLFIAVKLLKGIPRDGIINVLYFAVVLSFCIWMWAGWVGFATKLSRKLSVRIIAVVLAVLAFRVFFAPEIINWREYNTDLIENARLQQQPVLIKFTAGWCTNCEVVDRLVYKRKDIAKLIEKKDVLTIKADTTEGSFPATIDLKNVYHEPAIPVSILIVPGKAEPIRFHGVLIGEKLKEQLTKLPDKVE